MRVGIAGTGFMGSIHAEAWAATQARIAGFISKTEEEAAPLAQKHGAPVFTTNDELFDQVEVVDICTPTHLHYPLALAAAQAGKHIVCEKPLARTLKQGVEIVTACRKAGVKLLVAQVLRFFPEYLQAKQAVERGEIGRPGVIRLSRELFLPQKSAGNWLLDAENSGGLILDLMIHDFDYARWLAGEVESVYAKSAPAAGRDLSYHALAILRHRNGALTHVEGSWALPSPGFRTRFEVAGTEGLIRHDSDRSTPIALHLRQEGKTEIQDLPLVTSPLGESPYAREIKSFYQSLAEDSPPVISPEDGLAALQIALAAVESVERALPVSLKPLAELLS